MHEQEFERSVQQKMEELALQPSAPVWEKLEKSLHPKKRRRRGFAMWMLPAVVAGLGSAFWIFSNTGNAFYKTGVSKKEAIQNKVATGNELKDAANKKTKFYKADDTEKRHIVSDATTPKSDATNIRSKQVPAPHHGAYAFSGIIKKQENKAVVTRIQNHIESIGFDPKEKIDHDTLAYISVHSKQIIPLLDVSVSTHLEDLKFMQTMLPVLVPGLQKAAPAVRWHWSFDVQYGRATINDGGFFEAGKSLRVNDPVQNNTGGFGSGVAAQPALQIASGSFITTAFHLQRRLTNKTSVSAGIRYSLYTLRLRVGEKVSVDNLVLGNVSADALASEQLYKPDTVNSFFLSRYHFFALPVALQVQPFKSLPLEAEAGLVLGYLAGSKMLRYDTAARLFYVAKPTVQPIQLQAHAAISYRLAQTDKWQWLAGAQLHYHFTDLYTGNNTGKKLYALSAGIRVRKK